MWSSSAKSQEFTRPGTLLLSVFFILRTEADITSGNYVKSRLMVFPLYIKDIPPGRMLLAPSLKRFDLGLPLGSDLSSLLQHPLLVQRVWIF